MSSRCARLSSVVATGVVATGLAFIFLSACAHRNALDPVAPLPDTAPAENPEPLWRALEVEGFLIELPGVPERSEHTQTSPAGDLPTIAYTLSARDAAFNFSLTRFPSGLLKPAQSEAILKGASNGAITSIKGELIEAEETFLSLPDGRVAPGRSILVRTPDALVYQGRFYLVDDRLVQLSYVSSPEGGNSLDFQHFVDSLAVAGP